MLNSRDNFKTDLNLNSIALFCNVDIIMDG